MGLRGRGLILLGNKPASGPDLSGFLLYDNFQGAPASIIGRVPNKGAAWTATGAAAANIIAGGGVLTQNANVSAGYSLNNLGQVAKKVSAIWQISSGALDLPATLAIAQNTGLAPMLHGEGDISGGLATFFIRNVIAGPTFILPAYAVFSAAMPAISLATNYRTELHTDGSTWAAMKLLDSGNNLLYQEYSYDPNFINYVGNYVFCETYNTRLQYSLMTAEATSNYVPPAIGQVYWNTNPVTPAFYPTAFGGTTTNGAGLAITGAAYGQGGNIDLGNLNNGDRIYYSYDASGFSGGQMITTIIPTGQQALPISNQPPFTANGRIQGTLTMTSSGLGSFAIAMGPSLSGAGGCTVNNLLLLKNPPTTI